MSQIEYFVPDGPWSVILGYILDLEYIDLRNSVFNQWNELVQYMALPDEGSLPDEPHHTIPITSWYTSLALLREIKTKRTRFCQSAYTDYIDSGPLDRIGMIGYDEQLIMNHLWYNRVIQNKINDELSNELRRNHETVWDNFPSRNQQMIHLKHAFTAMWSVYGIPMMEWIVGNGIDKLNNIEQYN